MAVEVLSPWMWTLTVMLFGVATILALGLTFPKDTQKPRGTWSLPIVGDLWQLRSQGVRQFLFNNFARFGDPFRISLLGRTIIVMCTPESIKNVLSTDYRSFTMGYPANIHLLIGNTARFEPPYHPAFRKLTLAVGNPRGDNLSFLNSKARETVDSWGRVGTVNTCDELNKFAFLSLMHFSWSDIFTSPTRVQQIMEAMQSLYQGLYVARINLPYFCWYRALKGKASLYAQIQESVANRRKQGIRYEDLLGGLMEIPNISDDEICSLVIGVMFAGIATTSVLIQWTIKYLHDDPTLREAIQAEQDGIREKMTEDNFFESFNAVKACLPLTAQVIDEVLRIQSIAPVVVRQTKETVEYKGIAIPKGSSIWAATSSLHMNPELFPNPSMFNPSRFKTPVKPDTFMPFGTGPYTCPGSNLARSEAVFVVHHLLTKYSWETVGSDEGFMATEHVPTSKDGQSIIVRRRLP